MSKEDEPIRNKVLLRAYNFEGRAIEVVELSYDEYYEESSEMIDNNSYRRQKGIRRIEGRIFNSSGSLQQEFVNHYGEGGEYLHGRSVHQDGTIIED